MESSLEFRQGKVIAADIIAELFDESTDEAKKGGATGMDGITMKVWKFFFLQEEMIDMVRDFMQKNLHNTYAQEKMPMCSVYIERGLTGRAYVRREHLFQTI